MKGMDHGKEYQRLNQLAWNERTKLHLQSEFYDVKGFLSGRSSLREIELAELSVKGKSLLHLQCHFGLDTLSWAREGAASVAGLDLSDEAITSARQLAEQAAIDAEFVCGDLYQAPALLQRQFDLVYVSYGALVWLPDLHRWAETVSACLKPGGELYLAEFHPLQALFDGYDYFHAGKADVELEGSYTENAQEAQHTTVCWSHSLADVISALLANGLQLRAFREYDFSPYDCFEGLQEDTPGRFRLYHQGKAIPLVYSLRAVKEG